MSTDNEGSAVPPPADGTRPASSEPDTEAGQPAGATPGGPGAEAHSPSGPSEDASEASGDDDYDLAAPTGTAQPTGTARPGGGEATSSAPPPADQTARLGRPVADAPARPPGEPEWGQRTPPEQAPPTPPADPPTVPGAAPASAATAGNGVAGQTNPWWTGGNQQYDGAEVPAHGGPVGPSGPGGPGGGGPWGSPGPAGPPPPRKRTGGIVAAVLAAALVAGGIGGGVGYFAADRDDDTSSTTVSSGDSGNAGSRAPGSVAGIANKTLPSVVTIEARSGNGEGGTGTGFVYDKQGHILTNNHVVASAANNGQLTATFSNGKKYGAEVVGRAEGYDVAVIKLRNPGEAKLNPVPLGDSDKVSVGDATVAIGAPYGLSGTVTTGIVSAKNRPVASSDGGGSGASYMSALQTDASINPGNSGGPLLNAKGAVIGINSAIKPAEGGGGFGGETQQSGSIGLGFAIPMNQAKRVAQQLIKTGKPVYAVIKASVSTQQTGDGAKIPEDGAGGAQPVVPGGPAAKAGLRAGDLITKLDDVVIDSGPTLIGEIWNHQPGDTVTLTYIRKGDTKTTKVTLEAQEGDE